jgi:hypothetical protein
MCVSKIAEKIFEKRSMTHINVKNLNDALSLLADIQDWNMINRNIDSNIRSHIEESIVKLKREIGQANTH